MTAYGHTWQQMLLLKPAVIKQQTSWPITPEFLVREVNIVVFVGQHMDLVNSSVTKWPTDAQCGI